MCIFITNTKYMYYMFFKQITKKLILNISQFNAVSTPVNGNDNSNLQGTGGKELLGWQQYIIRDLSEWANTARGCMEFGYTVDIDCNGKH